MTGTRISKKEKERISNIISELNRVYGTEGRCFLNYETPWQLLIATILSAQCTDDRVNQVTATLFKKYERLEDFASADQKELEKDIHSTGFYKNKAKNIIACARRILNDFNGVVPRNIDDLVSLAGVGRKTANVIRGNIYKEPSIVVDTHVKRVSKRLGLTGEDDPVKIEFDLMKKLPEEQWIPYNRQIITHGRSICTARNPKCGQCFLSEFCTYGKLNIKQALRAEKKAKKPLNDKRK